MKYMIKNSINLIALCVLVLFTTIVRAESEVPSRATIDATLAKMGKFAEVNDYQSWAGFFAEDATFINSMMQEPAVGRDAIVELAGTWPAAQTDVQWRVIEGARMVMGWRERRPLENGKMSGWYTGFSSFVFNEKGEVQEYVGMFNPLAIKAAMQQAQ